MNLQGKTAIVTGAARGIGRSVCLELARRGCDIAFSYRSSREQAASLEAEVRGLGRRILSFQANAESFTEASTMVSAVLDGMGRISFLINNAGMIRDRPFVRMKETDWDEVIQVNLKGAFNYTKAVVPIMMKARYGAIVNISSVSGMIGAPGQANYSAAKAGLIGMTKSLARELAGRNITVNALAPGLIDTDMTRSLGPEYRERALKEIPLGRFGTADEVAHAAAFLLSDDARYITGQVIQIDGGLAM